MKEKGVYKRTSFDLSIQNSDLLRQISEETHSSYSIIVNNMIKMFSDKYIDEIKRVEENAEYEEYIRLKSKYESIH